MTLNDHWLKYAYPGIVTGILSDFCGLYATPLFLLAMLVTALRLWGRSLSEQWLKRWGLVFILLVDMVFILIKTNYDARGVYLHLLEPIIGRVGLVQDPLDLLALMVSPFCYRHLDLVESSR